MCEKPLSPSDKLKFYFFKQIIKYVNIKTMVHVEAYTVCNVNSKSNIYHAKHFQCRK